MTKKEVKNEGEHRPHSRRQCEIMRPSEFDWLISLLGLKLNQPTSGFEHQVRHPTLFQG